MRGSASRVLSPRSRPATGPGRRHGSAEQGNDHGRDNSVADRRSLSAARDRERDRDRQMGPQETADWDDAIEKIHSRLSALEANQRNHAQYFGKTHESATHMKSVADKLEIDYPAYKTYVQERLSSIFFQDRRPLGSRLQPKPKNDRNRQA